MATYPHAHLQFFASGMVLYVHSDTSNLVLLQAKSRFVGYLFFKTNLDILNALIHIACKTLKHVVSSAAETETGVGVI